MNQKAIHTLEFDKIINQLAECASSEPGRLCCLDLKPSFDREQVERMQAQTAAALTRLFRKELPSLGNVRDLKPTLLHLDAGGAISQSELLQLAALLENTAMMKSYGRRDREEEGDCLDPYFDHLEPLSLLSGEIRRCILSPDEISSDASPELRQIRRSIRLTGDRVHSQINELMNGSLRSYLQDAVVTMRDGRYCLPVKSEHRASVPGMIHDQSSTGATLFIEPMAIVKLNNDIRALEIKEAREIERILAELSAKAAPYTGTIRDNIQNLTELDFIFARGRLAMQMNATRPLLNSDGIIRLRKARHPLIDPKSVVPIDLTLGETSDLLIITGPNTGGKTVSLKTVGLLSMMGQAGLHIPALDRSELTVFREIFADIGDEQSIEQSLSTFSSHMTNTVSILKEADRDSLVLFDELGAGTDPVEGAALAIAILSFLHGKGIRTMATTHYSELKLYALQTEGVENASCEFDVATLRPTYRLLVGVPGRSNAFAISSRLGLPDEIIDLAREQISEQDASFEDVLSALEQRRIELERQKEVLERERREIEEARRTLTENQTRLDTTRQKILREANEEARAILYDAKEYADKTIREMRKSSVKSGSQAEMEKKRAALRGRIKEADQSLTEQSPRRQGKRLRPGDVRTGDAVRVLSLNLKGIVDSRPDARGNLYVRMGIMRSKVNLDDLELIEEPDVLKEGVNVRPGNRSAKGTMQKKTDSGRTGVSGVRMEKSFSAGMEINLLGKRVDEAISELDKFIDDAHLAHLQTVRIIHGKGTGRLREGVHTYLRSHPQVSEFHLAAFGEGDAGVTIATLS